MKGLTTFLIMMLTVQTSIAQACGTYRIRYVGTVTSSVFNVTNIQLPTTLFLHGMDDENSKRFVTTKVNGGKFILEIGSHLTFPYSTKESLLALYQSKSAFLKIRIVVSDNGVNKEIDMNIKWTDIEVTIIDDDQFGTLFEFKMSDIVI